MSKLIGDANKLIWGASKLIGDANKLIGGANKLIWDANKLIWDTSKLIGDTSKLFGDASKLIGGESKLIGDVSKLIGDVSKLLTDERKLLAEVNKFICGSSSSQTRLSLRCDLKYSYNIVGCEIALGEKALAMTERRYIFFLYFFCIRTTSPALWAPPWKGEFKFLCIADDEAQKKSDLIGRVL